MGILGRLIGVAAVFISGWYMGALIGIPGNFSQLAAAGEGQNAATGEKAQTYKEEPGAPFVMTASPSIKPDLSAAVSPASTALANVKLCKMKVSNAPATNAERVINDFPETVSLNGVSLLAAPITQGCFSSGYGPRGKRLHKGIDYFSKTGGDVIAAADGVIVDFIYREKDFGYMIVLDHGDSVYTRYAHLAEFAEGLSEGALVTKGTILGPIGQTGRAFAPHLHYEVLSGAYVSGAGSFGLKTHNPLNP